MTALDDLADRYVEDFAGHDPCRAAMMGIAGYEGRLTDYGPGGFAARDELTRRTLAELGATAAEGEQDRIAAAVLRERLEVELALSEAGMSDAALNGLDGPLQRLRQAIELLDQRPATPWADVSARIAALPAALAGLTETLGLARRDGRVSAVRQILICARQCEQTAGYLTTLVRGYGDGPLRRELEGAARSAAGALEAFGGFLTGELAPHAPRRDAVGRDRYALQVRNFLGTRLDLEETYAWGWEELARIESEMRVTAARLAPGDPLEAVFAALDADPAHRILGAGDFRDWIQELADEAIAALDGVHFDIPDELRRIECRIPPTDSGGIYYLAPAEDLSRPGQVWWTVPAGTEEVVTWSVPATMFHEGVPGHHLQLGMTVLNAAKLNRFQRVSAELFPGHCEGWALYAERLMAELGYYADPAHYLGMLAGGQQLRAARVILDIGLHLELEIPKGTGFHEGERWNRELGAEFLGLHCGPESEFFVNFEVDRYLGLPGQAIAYKVGERVWLEAREAARRRQGAAFDLRAFHRDALDLGPMGLDLLRAELVR
ncbi:DUF885 domain-containing protein [Actinomadura scrupuli]|uniref:DUF885 domain-containing protein n=1 Tax=Actinomadura scrupuli TaxID=559629 RepID=UPI003D959E42